MTDIFVFAPVDGYDIIMDFAVGVDHLQFTASPPNLSFSGVGADTVIAYGDNAITLVGVDLNNVLQHFGELFV